MPATRLCRADAGKLIDGLKDLSTLLEDLGLESGNVKFSVNGDIQGLRWTKDAIWTIYRLLGEM